MRVLLVQVAAAQNIMVVQRRKIHGVDFCGECNEFPCKKTQGLFEETVYQQWLEGNQQIREYGIEEFWKNNSENPHYKPYKK